MIKPVKVLLVDDKEDYCISLAGKARYSNIQIEYKLDWETGFEFLKKNPNIEFVILDGKGKKNADQETEKDNFFMQAKSDLDKYSLKIGKHIPYCLNTGFIDRFETVEGLVEIFGKSGDESDRMFNYIFDEISKSPSRTSRIIFEEPFLVFDQGIISPQYETLLVQIIECYENQDFRKKNLTILRDLLEAIFKSLGTQSIPCIPRVFFNEDGRPKLGLCARYMNDIDVDIKGRKLRLNKEVPKNIGWIFNKLKESTSAYSHLKDEDYARIPYLSNMFLLFELLEWLPTFVNNNYSNFR